MLHVPVKVDGETQREFVKKYRRVRKTYDEIYFIDGCPPTHNSVPSYAWIHKGKEKKFRQIQVASV